VSKQTILKSFQTNDKDWEEAEKRTPEERFESVKRVAKRMGCLSDNPDTIKKFMKYHFKDKHRNKDTNNCNQ